MWLSTLGLLVTFSIGLLWPPLVATAQPAENVRRLGLLGSGAAPSAAEFRQSPFVQALHDLGWVEGHNLTVERRYAEGHSDRLPALATELIHVGVEVIVTIATPAAQAAKHATTTIPIVFTLVNEPVEQGLVASLAQPGGNLTGVSTLSSPLSGKRLELLKEAAPGVTRVAVVWNAANPGIALQFHEAQDAARGLGLSLQSLAVHGPDALDHSGGLQGHFYGMAGDIGHVLTGVVDPCPSVHVPSCGQYCKWS